MTHFKTLESARQEHDEYGGVLLSLGSVTDPLFGVMCYDEALDCRRDARPGFWRDLAEANYDETLIGQPGGSPHA